jgi:hypothetical protein
MESERLFLWIAFKVFVLGMLAVDLGVFHRKAHTVSIKEASIWSVAPPSSPSRMSGFVHPAVIGWIALFLVVAYLMLATMGLHRRWLDEQRIDHHNGLVESNPADAK